VPVTARRADGGERVAALATELPACLVVGSARGTMHDALLGGAKSTRARTEFVREVSVPRQPADECALERHVPPDSRSARMIVAPARSPTLAKPCCSYRWIAGLSGSTLRLILA